MKVLFIIFSTALLLSCKSSKDIEAKVPPVELISMVKTPCRGQCPAYKISIYDNMTAVYHGRRHVDMMGFHNAVLETSVFDAIKLKFEKSNWAALESKYEMPVMDPPKVIFTYKGKQVSFHKNVAPDKVLDLMIQVDGLLDSVEWQPF